MVVEAIGVLKSWREFKEVRPVEWHVHNREAHDSQMKEKEWER